MRSKHHPQDNGALFKAILIGCSFFTLTKSILQAQNQHVFVRFEIAANQSIEGEVTEPGYSGWVRGLSVDQHFTRGNRDAHARFQDIRLRLLADGSTLDLLRAFERGDQFARVVVVQAGPADKAPSREATRVEILEAEISEFNMGIVPSAAQASAIRGRPIVDLKLQFSQTRWFFLPSAQESLELALTTDSYLGTRDPALDHDDDGLPNEQDDDDDNDRLPDQYELAVGTDPFANDAAHDLDRDGQSNLDEFLTATWADNPQSRFRTHLRTNSQAQPRGGRLEFTTRPKRRYRILASESGRDWQEIRLFDTRNDNASREVSFPVTFEGELRLLRVEVDLQVP